MNNNNNGEIAGGGSHHLGLNKISRNIRKSPIHQTNFQTNPNKQHLHQQQQQQNSQPQPQIYNISKNDFRNLVQQLTGTPSREPCPNSAPIVPPAPRPTTTSKSPSLRLQRIRPPPLAPIARPAIPNPNHNFAPIHNPNPAFLPRALPAPMPALSPVSIYMRYLENSIMNPDGSRPTQLRPPPAHPAHTQFPNYSQQDQAQLRDHRQSFSALLPTTQPPPSSGLFPVPQPSSASIGFPSHGAASHPPPTAVLHSPALPSPSAFLNLLSPRSPYPSLSPRFQFPPPLSPTFLLSPLPQSGGILGSCPQPLPSPGSLFPSSPSGFLLSPRWRDLF